MKAIIFEQYGSPDVLQYVDLPRPGPSPNEVLVKVHAASLNAADWHIMRGKPYIMRVTFGMKKPKINRIGCDLSGVVEAVGDQVTDFKVGDEVFGEISGNTFNGFGAFREYITVPGEFLSLKPRNATFEEAAAVPLAAISALQGLRKGDLKSGEHILINGASGGVGTFAVQLAKELGAKVTAVCSTPKVEMVKALGADQVIDYKKEDFNECGEKYDMILAVNGALPLLKYKRSLKQKGRYVVCGGNNRQLFETMLYGWVLALFSSQKFGTLMARSNKEDLANLKTLVEDGKIKPIIERTYPLHETPEAMRHLEEGHARGKIVLKIVR